MLKKVKRFIELTRASDEPFEVFYLRYMKKVQDQNIDAEVRNMIRFNLMQLSQFDQQIETDYRKLVNESNAQHA